MVIVGGIDEWSFIDFTNRPVLFLYLINLLVVDKKDHLPVLY